jgi:hypothetical protein
MQIAGYPGADARTVNEVRGWLYACAGQAAGHVTDNTIDFGTAQMFGGARTRKLIGWCVQAGLLSETDVDGVTQWLIIDDPDFLHGRTKAELAWERQQRADAANPGLTVPVRLRDGDNCRYCGVLVRWIGTGKSQRRGELDHREPGKPAIVDTFVVACRTCNRSRQANPHWDADHPLRPVPTVKHYHRETAEFLTQNGYPTEANVGPGSTRRSSADHATAPAAHTAPRAQRPASRERSATDATPAAQPGHDDPADDATAPVATVTAPSGDPAPAGPERPLNAVPGSTATSWPGTGRDGAGGASRQRGRRGKRGRKGGRSPTPCCSSPYPQTDPETGASTCLTCGHQTPPHPEENP